MEMDAILHALLKQNGLDQEEVQPQPVHVLTYEGTDMSRFQHQDIEMTETQ